MIDFLQDTFCVDPARIYATGHSNGGGFVGLLACSADHGGQFAAFAPVSPALYTDLSGNDNCSPQRSPMPILEFHSRDDPTVFYQGGQGSGGPLPAITEWLGRWVSRNGCRTPSVTTLPSGTKHHVWGCGSKERNLQHYEHLHEGHSWPRTEVDASKLIIEWLVTQKKPIYN
jgi:poly(3-hydroxybutyrate) depolymerase